MGQGRSARPAQLIVFGALPIALAAQSVVGSLAGYWTNERQSVVIQISECGDVALCGKVISASDKARDDARRGGTDNLVGAELMSGFVEVRPGRWKGRLFIPDLNRSSGAEIALLEGNRLRVRGCAVGGMICRSQIWSRMPGPAAAE